jgi:hypothetical protein
LIDAIKIFEEAYKRNTGRNIQKDANEIIKEKKAKKKLNSSVNRLLEIFDIPNSTFYKPHVVNGTRAQKKAYVDSVVLKAYNADELNSNLGRDGIYGVIRETGEKITLKQIRNSKKRLGIFSTKQIIHHRKPKEEKDVNADVPNLLNGMTKCDVPLKYFSSDTTCIKTKDSPNT